MLAKGVYSEYIPRFLSVQIVSKQSNRVIQRGRHAIITILVVFYIQLSSCFLPGGINQFYASIYSRHIFTRAQWVAYY